MVLGVGVGEGVLLGDHDIEAVCEELSVGLGVGLWERVGVSVADPETVGS